MTFNSPPQSHKSVPKHHSHSVTIKAKPHFDFAQPHKKYARRPKLEPLRPPSRLERQHVVNNADIKQYDFHSSSEEDYSLVRAPTDLASVQSISLA